MNLDLESLSENMLRLYRNVLMGRSNLSLYDLKISLINKEKLISTYLEELRKVKFGKIAKSFINDLEKIEADFRSLHTNFDDKLMIFIIGNGNTGKSTLLNTLVGEKVAKTNFLPTTWNIDIYTPEINDDISIIKYINGKEDRLQSNEVEAIVKEENRKSKEAKKKFNEKLREELKNNEIKTKEEREEIKKYLGEKYLYRSNISEVRRAVKKNWLLEKCLLVDTPGLNQNLHDINQLGNINDYYHKADGVIWLLDGTTIAASNVNEEFDILEKTLNTVGGIRENIIGVINKMDLVRNDGGDEYVKRVEESAKDIFKDKFSNIISISAETAFDGVKNNDIEVLKRSGILELQNSIREIFMLKAESLKSGAKSQGYNKLLVMSYVSIDKYYHEVNKYGEIYNNKNDKLVTEIKKLKSDIENDIETFFNNYLNAVRRRVDLHIDRLSEGEGASFVRDSIYQVDELMKKIRKFSDDKYVEIESKSRILNNVARISEYKHIKVEEYKKIINLMNKLNLDISSINNISYFKPSIDNDLFSVIGNIIGKTVFFFKKNKIKSDINTTIRKECKKIEDYIKNELFKGIDIIFNNSKKILDITFEELLFQYKHLDRVKKSLERLKEELGKENDEIDLRRILGEK